MYTLCMMNDTKRDVVHKGEVERLLSAAIGELRHDSGDPVPDLLRALGALLPSRRGMLETWEMEHELRKGGAL